MSSMVVPSSAGFIIVYQLDRQAFALFWKPLLVGLIPQLFGYLFPVLSINYVHISTRSQCLGFAVKTGLQVCLPSCCHSTPPWHTFELLISVLELASAERCPLRVVLEEKVHFNFDFVPVCSSFSKAAI